MTVTPYRNGGELQPGKAETITDGTFTTLHGIALDSLKPGTTYAVELGGKTSEGGKVSLTIPSFATTNNSEAPVMQHVKTERHPVPGQNSTIQMIVTWVTDRRATSKVRYQKGVVTEPNATLSDASPLETSFDKSHTVVLVGLDPGTVYSFQVESTDFDGHTAVLPHVHDPHSQAGTGHLPGHHAGVLRHVRLDELRSSRSDRDRAGKP